MKNIPNKYSKAERLEGNASPSRSLRQSLVLCGFMGSGKTCIGKLLGKELETPFVDTDEYIRDTYKMSIHDIFLLKGESGFREYEHEALKRILQFPPYIIAAGGGLPLFKRNLSLLENLPIICLMPDFDTLYPRIQNDRSRPLILDKSYECIKALYESRRETYLRNADFITKNSSTPKDCVEEIIHYLKRNSLLA